MLVGGLYGVAIGGVFFGESMFSLARDASKVALVHLVARLRLGGFQLLDTQFVTAHLAQFGAEELTRERLQGSAGPRRRFAGAVFRRSRTTAALAAEIRRLAGRLSRHTRRPGRFPGWSSVIFTYMPRLKLERQGHLCRA